MKALVLIILILLSGCSSYNSFTRLDAMPEPLIYSDEILKPSFYSEKEARTSRDILYVTDRLPAQEQDQEKYYKNARNDTLRAGAAEILPASKPDNTPSSVTSVREFGFLANVLPYSRLSAISDESFSELTPADELLTDAIDEQLQENNKKDIYIYVHGYKVVFENPLLVTHELWRFMNHDGVFLAYAWPSTPKRFAYFKDIETAQLSGQNLRLLLEYLAENTEAERIHIVGYSAGTRVVITAIQQLALKYSHLSQPEIRNKLKIGNVILTASDYDISVFAASIGNGLLDIPSRMTIYMSGSDKALGISSWIFSQQRLGQFVTESQTTMNPHIKGFFANHPSLHFVDATRAENSDSGNGHGYFIKSPWVSSDILMLLKDDTHPDKRGLTRREDDIQWEFPSNYKERLHHSITKPLNN